VIDLPVDSKLLPRAAPMSPADRWLSPDITIECSKLRCGTKQNAKCLPSEQIPPPKSSDAALGNAKFSHDLHTGAFLLERRTGGEIWVKHRTSGHVVCFAIAENGGTIEGPHRIDLQFRSRYDARELIPGARRAACEYLTDIEAMERR
jgi:hypothetical protein